MLDLKNIKYDRKTLKEYIYAISLIEVIKTQILDVTFIVRYVLNKKYHIHDEDEIISVPIVLKYQSHIKQEELLKALLDYDSDDDSVDDFETISNRN